MLELPGLEYDPLPAKPATPPAKPDVPRTRRNTAEAPPAARARRYAIGDVGPGSGIVFYDAGSEQSWGRYLEAAPARWNGKRKDPSVPWGHESVFYVDIAGAKGKAIGDGMSNTAAMVEVLSSGAGVLASSYAGGGHTDWFLPSRLELNALFKQRIRVGGFTEDGYWSSSQTIASRAWFKWFNEFGGQETFPTGLSARLRPVRAF